MRKIVRTEYSWVFHGDTNDSSLFEFPVFPPDGIRESLSLVWEVYTAQGQVDLSTSIPIAGTIPTLASTQSGQTTIRLWDNLEVKCKSSGCLVTIKVTFIG